MACCTTVAMASYHKCSHFIIIDIMELQELQGNVSFNRILASYRGELWTKPFFTPIIRSRKLYFFRRRKRDFFLRGWSGGVCGWNALCLSRTSWKKLFPLGFQTVITQWFFSQAPLGCVKRSHRNKRSRNVFPKQHESPEWDGSSHPNGPPSWHL